MRLARSSLKFQVIVTCKICLFRLQNANVNLELPQPGWVVGDGLVPGVTTVIKSISNVQSNYAFQTYSLYNIHLAWCCISSSVGTC